MAILQGCPGIKVSIVSNGKALDEYPDEDRELNNKDFSVPDNWRAMVYIECTSDAEFGIEWEITSDYKPQVPHTHLRFRAFVDGKSIGGDTKRIPESGSWNGILSETFDRINDLEGVQRKLMFKTIKKVDDSDSARVKADIELTDGLGEILVVVHRCTKTGVIQAARQHNHISNRPSTTTEIAEKALKGQAISHGVGASDQRLEFINRNIARMLNLSGRTDDDFLCVFFALSIDLEALQQELIIPRSPSPEDLIMGPLNPRDQNEANASLSREERLARLKAEIEEIKSEVKEEDPRSRKHRLAASSSQNGGRAYKTSRHNGSKVIDLIDLTDD